MIGASNHLLRLTTATYGDGTSSMATGVDPVVTAQIVFDQDGLMPNGEGLSDLFVSWGQFMDHDLSLTLDNSGEHVFVPGLVAPFERSAFDPSTGTSDVREQINAITPSMDASMLYGSDSATEASLRTFQDGALKMGDDGLLSLTGEGMAGATPDAPLFLSGDVRANENTGLTVLHNLFSMEHNHWAQKIAAHHTDWSDEQIFQAARSIVEYEIQKITYDQWLPHLVGGAVGADTGYDASVSGQISTEFSTAGFRFGHTMVSPTILQIEEDGTASTQGDISVQDVFFNISPIQDNGVEDILRGMTAAKAQMSDAVVIDDLNFFLELANGLTGFSLPALNILRGRDHGLGTYVEVRAELLGDLDPATLDPTDFSVITSDAATQAKLEQAYGTIDKVDLWVGGLAEDDIGGGQLGPLFTLIVADQFTRTRAADDSFGQIDPALDPSLLDGLGSVTLSDIIVRNTGVSHAQEDVFVAANRIGGDDGRDRIKGTDENDLILGFGGKDKLKGRDGDDAIYGGDGKDWLSGGRGDDVLSGGDGCDYLKGGRGDDVLSGGDDRDYLKGGRGDDFLSGGDDRDYLKGGRGDDTLDSGSGNDKMKGGSGDDIFVFGQGDGYDVIKDFNRGDDAIDLSDFDLNSFADVRAVACQKSWGVELNLGEDKLFLCNTRVWCLSEDDFILS